MPMTLVSFPLEYDQNVQVRIFNGLREQPNYYAELFNIDPTEDYITETAGYGGFGTMGQWPDGEPLPIDEAVRVFQDSMTQVFYGMGFAVTRKHLPRTAGGYGYGQLRLVQQWANSLSRSVMQTLNVRHAAVFNNAFTTTYDSLGGQVLYSDTHLTANGANDRSNFLAAAALTPANLQGLMLVGWNNTNHRGLRDPIRYTKIAANPALERTITKILESNNEPFTTDNDINTQKGKLAPHLNPFLTSATQWNLQSDTHGLQTLVGMPPTPKRFMDEDTETLVHGVATDFVTGVEFFEGSAGCAGA